MTNLARYSARLPLIVLLLILVLSFILRLYRFDNPVADWHAWRQADTAAVSKYFTTHGFDLLHPKYFDLSNIPSGIDNPEGYRFVEFPIYNILQAGAYSVFGVFSLEQWGRLISILASLSTSVWIYLILKKYCDVFTGLVGAFLFGVLPYSIFYSRTILPDELMIATAFGAIYFFSEWTRHKESSKGWVWYGLSLGLFSSSLLLKPYAIFFSLPMIYLAWQTWKTKMLTQWTLWVFAFVTIVPLALWRFWMSQYPEGIPANAWLFNAGNIRFKGAFFYWIFGERIGKLILGYFGLIFLGIGLIKLKGEQHYAFFLSFLASALLYVTVIARGNVQHDYYQILIVPAIVLFLARGVRFLQRYAYETNKITAITISIAVTLLMLSLSWYYVRDYFNINNRSIIDAGKKADEILPKDAKVIAPLTGDTTLLYAINRQGWPSFQESLESLRAKGATHVVLVNPSESDIASYTSQYSIVASTAAYLIVSIE